MKFSKFAAKTAMGIMVLASIVNCPEKKKPNNSATAGVLFLATQNTFEATISVVGKIKNADGSALSGSNGVGLVRFSNKTDSSNLIIENNTNPQDFTTNSGTTAADNGDFSVVLKVNSATGSIAAVVTQCNACTTSTQYDTAANYTKAFGSFDLNLALSSTGGTATTQVTVANATGLQAEIKQVTVTIKGQYNLSSPTVGENICDGKNVTGTPETISGNITGAKTITNAAQLSGTVYVTDGATLTINAGSVVFGNRGSSLFVLPGGKIVSNGTATNPVCFTSSQSPGSRFPGDWGGLVIIGKGKGTRSSTTEGTTPQNYGSGTDDADNSGTLNYTIIEFAGNEVAPGDELNALSLYTVGSGTKIEYVQAHRGLDDSFEAWGGAVNLRYVMATGGLDDDYDLDEGYAGTIEYAIGHKYPSSCGGSVSTDPHGFEMDGQHSGATNTATCTNGTAQRCTSPTIRYFTMIGANITSGEAARLREGFAGNISSGIFYNYAGNSTGAFLVGSDSTGFPANSFNLTNTVYVPTGKTASVGTSATYSAQATLSALPITSAGDTDNCGFAATKPDYTTVTSSGAPSTVGASANGVKWWDGWSVYRAR